MAVPLTNTFEGGSNGTTITTGNSGGGSGNAFDVVDIGTGYTLTYANSPVVAQSLCCLITPGATSSNCDFEWDIASVGTIGPTVYTRFYVLWPSQRPFGVPNTRVLQLYGASTQRCALVIFGSASPGKFTWADAADSAGTSSTTTLVAGTVYRFECKWTLSTTVGEAVINCYAGDSTSVLETLTSPASQNFGATTCTNVTFGYTVNGSNTSYGAMALDGLAIGTTGYFGPVGTPVTSTFSVNF